MREIRIITFIALTLVLTVFGMLSAEITRKDIRFVEYPNFPDAHSTWSSIGYSKTHRKVFIGVTNHRDRVGLYEYDVIRDRMRLCGFLPERANCPGAGSRSQRLLPPRTTAISLWEKTSP
jgi:hypothetical protein